MMEKLKVNVPIMADVFAKGERPEYLFWVGSAGAFDDRYKKVTREFVKILTHFGISYAVLGTEEADSGDVARRAGNEMLFQMQALMNIELFKMYEVKKILTCCPHDYNTFKNEYADFGGEYEVVHHSQFLASLLQNSKFQIPSRVLGTKQIQNSKNQTQKALTQNSLTQNTLTENALTQNALTQNSELKITFHDPCYLGRANGEYDAPRAVLHALYPTVIEMKRSKSFALCCGAGGGQMFKEAEKGDKEVFIERIEDVMATGADIVTTACPFCMVMLTDGIKYKNREETLKNYDIAELVSLALGL